MKGKRSLVAGLTTLAALLAVSVAWAIVNYDPATGGFAGKGDVQTALGGINDKTLTQLYGQGGIVFTYAGQATYEQECTMLAVGGNPAVVKNVVNHTQPYVVTVPSSAVTVTSTKASGKDVGQKQISGFNLAAIGSNRGAPPSNICPPPFEPYADYVGDTDQPEDPNGWVDPTTPQLVSSTGGLFVNDVSLPNTPTT